MAAVDRKIAQWWETAPGFLTMLAVGYMAFPLGVIVFVLLTR